MIDLRPRLIARCESAADVASAVRFGVDSGLELAIRGGGRSFSGASCVDDGLMIDLGRMNSVVVDPVAKTATCGPGCSLAEVDATQQHGSRSPAGRSATPGIAGLTLGDGFGWLTNGPGLTLDNLVGADVVLADGRLVRASVEENPDLFWAIRGGGGNFGVVTWFEYRLHEVGPMVNLGFFFWDLDGGYCDPGEDDTAFGGRCSPMYVVNMAAIAPTPDLLELDRAWVRGFYDALLPCAGDTGVYVNFMVEYEEDRVRAACGPAKHDRLARLKAAYDPGNVFHRNTNIKPA